MRISFRHADHCKCKRAFLTSVRRWSTGFGLVAVFLAGCSASSSSEDAPRAAAKSTTAATPAAVAEITWQTDLEAAKKIAAAEKKDLFICFTGLAWCGPCNQLENQVFRTAAFAPVTDKFVMVQLDYDQGVARLPQEPADAEQSWKEQYGVSGWPTIFLADATGRPYAATGNLQMKPAPYLADILRRQTAHAARDTAFAAAAEAEGVAKAKHLAAGLTAMRPMLDVAGNGENADSLLRFYRPEVDAILALDANNAAGLKSEFDKIVAAGADHAELRELARQVNLIFREQGAEGVLSLLDEKLADRPVNNSTRLLRVVQLQFMEMTGKDDAILSQTENLLADANLPADMRSAVRVRRAGALVRKGRVDEAIPLFQETVRESQDNPRIAYRVLLAEAEVLTRNNFFQQALAAYEQAVPLAEPGSADWRIVQARRIGMLARLGRAKDAWRVLDEVDASGTITRFEKAGMIVQIAEQLEAQGSHEPALAAANWAEELLNQAPPNGNREVAFDRRFRQIIHHVKTGEPLSNAGVRPASRIGTK